MELSDKQKFKAGFLLKCAEEGLTIKETHIKVKQLIAMHKQAFNPLDLITKPVGLIGNLAGNIIKTLPSAASTAATIGLAAPVGVGLAGGYGLAKMTNPDKHVIDDLKQDEVVGEYERLAEEAKRRSRIKKLQEQTGRRIIALTPKENV